MKTSDKGLELIKHYESLRLKAYRCPAGIPTIGYGHTKGVKMGQSITEEQANAFLVEDLSDAEQTVIRHRLNINQNQFDALVSFVFNVGSGNFAKSTLLKKAKVNSNDGSIANEFRKWVYAKGVVMPGLIKRREAETKLYYGMA